MHSSKSQPALVKRSFSTEKWKMVDFKTGTWAYQLESLNLSAQEMAKALEYREWVSSLQTDSSAQDGLELSFLT